MRSLLFTLVAVLAAGCDRPQDPAPPPPPAAAPVPLPVMSPQEAWETRRHAWLTGDAKAVWETLSTPSREAKLREQEKVMEDMRKMPDDSLARALQPYGMSAGQFLKMTAKEWCLYVIQGASQSQKLMEKTRAQEFVSGTVEGRRAACVVRAADGHEEAVVFVAEGGEWKLDEAETARRNGRASK